MLTYNRSAAPKTPTPYSAHVSFEKSSANALEDISNDSVRRPQSTVFLYSFCRFDVDLTVSQRVICKSRQIRPWVPSKMRQEAEESNISG
jgi:hypothetical protein